MTIRIMIGLLAAAFAVTAIQTPATAQAAPSSATNQQCRWETPPQFGPRAPVQAPTWICTSARAEKPRGHYEYYWPIWASQRALPLVRTWVPDRK
jgi:hypothetical protein